MCVRLQALPEHGSKREDQRLRDHSLLDLEENNPYKQQQIFKGN
jgi:hypothetical protein